MEIKNSYVLVASCTRKGHFRQLTSPAADEIDKNARREAAACRNAGRAGRILMDAADICLETGYLLRASHLYYDALLLMADYSLEHRTLRLAHEMSRAGRGLENVKRRVGGTTSYTEEMRVRDLLKTVTALYQKSTSIWRTSQWMPMSTSAMSRCSSGPDTGATSKSATTPDNGNAPEQMFRGASAI